MRFPALLRNRNFVLLWCAYFISAAGDHLSEMALLKTQHAMDTDVDVSPMMARMTFVFFVPFFLLGPAMGWIADRLSRRRVMIFADLVRCGLMAAFAGLIAFFASRVPGWGPFVPIGIVGVFAAMFSPARSALLPRLIREGDLIPANALIRGVGVLATAIATKLGGWLADTYHPVIAFRIDAATFAASAALVFFICPPTAAHQSSGQGGGALRELLGGFRYAATHRRVRNILMVGTVFWLSASGVRCLLPAIAKNAYHLATYSDVTTFLVLLAIGMLVGAATLAIIGDAVSSDVAIIATLSGAAISAALLGISAVAPIGPQVGYYLGAVAVAGLGVFGAALIASYNAFLQRIVPDRYMGRVFGVLDLTTMGGLLVATGLLGIPQWHHLDKWAGHVVLLIAACLATAGIWGLQIRRIEKLRTAARRQVTP